MKKQGTNLAGEVISRFTGMAMNRKAELNFWVNGFAQKKDTIISLFC